MVNSNKTIFQIFVEGFGIYVKHLPTFLKYMSFPVLGQIFGVILAIALPLFSINQIVPSISDPQLALAVTLAFSIPGLLLVVKAFWQYLISYVAICSMTENTIKSGRIYDIPAHVQVAINSKRIGQFILLWIIFSLFTIIAIFPPSWLFAIIIFVFISLVFQVFTFETKMKASNCFLLSFVIVNAEKNFFKTVGLLGLLFFVSYILLPKCADIILSLIQVEPFFVALIDPIIANVLPFDNWNSIFSSLGISFMITSLEVSKMLISTIVSTLIICFTLPLRSICMTLLYKDLVLKNMKHIQKTFEHLLQYLYLRFKIRI